MTEKEGFRPRTIDQRILEFMIEGCHDDQPWGRITPGIVASDLDHSPEYVVNRLSMLHAAGYVTKPAKGFYELTHEGIETVENTE